MLTAPLEFTLKLSGFYVLVASTELLNGILRTLYLNRALGVRAAKRVSIVPALGFCLLICFFYVPLLGVATAAGQILLGVSLSAFMLAFDVAMGRAVLKMNWSRVLEDLDLRKGNLLALGLLAMAFCPWLAMRLRSLF